MNKETQRGIECKLSFNVCDCSIESPIKTSSKIVRNFVDPEPSVRRNIEASSSLLTRSTVNEGEF